MSDSPILKSVTTIAAAGDASTTITSSIIDISNCYGMCIQSVITGSPTGTISYQISLDGTNFGEVNSTAVSSAGTYIDDYGLTSGIWLRVVYTPSGGSGTITISVSQKQI